MTGLEAGKSVFDPSPRGAPKLEAVGGKDRARFYLRYVKSGGSRDRLAIGHFDADGRAGLTLAEARDLAGELTRRYAAGDRDLRDVIAAEDADRKAAEAQAVASADAATLAAKDADKLTLMALCNAYADDLERQGKTSAPRVRRALERNVGEAFPATAEKPAAEITADCALELIERLTDEGKAREAGKLRAYLRAAFASAINAKRKAGALPALRTIGRTLSTNPVRDLGTVAGSMRTRERVLSVAEIRAYWKHVKALAAPAGPLLQFHLLTGAQRLEQLARATTADVDNDEKALLLLDTKGRRVEPRRHWVPLLPQAVEAMEQLRSPSTGQFVFTLSNGKRAANPTTVAHTIRRECAAMLEAGSVAEPFTAGDIRRTVETRLAALGVPLEVRAQLQSHGLGGVQARHYDRHSYSAEKRDALRLLLGLLTSKPATVTPIRRKAKA